MKSLLVNEIFYTLQGEGCRSGQPSIFIRLAECNLECSFCDTEFESGRLFELNELLEQLKQYPCNWIVWTGGEPLLQLDFKAAEFFNKAGYCQSVETNGSVKMFNPISRSDMTDSGDWISVIDLISISPKVAEHVIKQNFEHIGFDLLPSSLKIELRYARHKGHSALPDPPIAAHHHYISPIFDGDNPNAENIAHCIKLIMEGDYNSPYYWALSLQAHKFVGLL